MLSLGLSAHSTIRLFDIQYESKKYYVVALSPRRTAPIRLGSGTRSFSPLPNGEMGLILTNLGADGHPIDHDYEILEYLFYSGEPMRLSPMDAPDLARIRNAQFQEDFTHAVVERLFNTFEEWSIEQYIRRGRVNEELESRIRQELAQIEDGYGWIALLDENKEILSTLAVASRTVKSPILPLESSHGLDIEELPYKEVMNYPIIGTPIHSMGPLAPILTFELKRFINTRNSPFYSLPLLIYFGEKTGMTWSGPATRFQKMYKGKILIEGGGVRSVAGKYVLESDAKAAEVYSRPPFSLPDPIVRNKDSIFEFSREQFVRIFVDSLDAGSSRKIQGQAFFEHAEIRRGNQLKRAYEKPSFAEFKKKVLGTSCQNMLTINQSRSS